MAHHGLNDLNKLQESGMNTFIKSMTAEQAARLDPLMDNPVLGPTGNFPNGKIDQEDEGEIRIGITHVEDRVVLHFGTPIKWIGFTKEQANMIAQSLLDHA